MNNALNNAGTHPFLCAFAERIRGSNDVLATHGSVVGKYAGKGDYEQNLHSDHPHNTPVVPRRALTKTFDMPMLIYHSDVTIDLGPTYVVSLEHTEPHNLFSTGWTRGYPREKYPEFYEKEVPVLVPAGSVIIYSSGSLICLASLTTQ